MAPGNTEPAVGQSGGPGHSVSEDGAGLSVPQAAAQNARARSGPDRRQNFVQQSGPRTRPGRLRNY